VAAVDHDRGAERFVVEEQRVSAEAADAAEEGEANGYSPFPFFVGAASMKTSVLSSAE
jgi:hypothetical protein